VAKLTGALDMLRRQPDGIRESMGRSAHAASQAFVLQVGEVRAALTAHIQRTRQSLSGGMVATAAHFMEPAYAQARSDPGGGGIKSRMLTTLTAHAGTHAPALFVTMRQELAEGLTVLQASMKPQLSQIVSSGERIFKQFRHNLGTQQAVTADMREGFRRALEQVPQLSNVS